MKKEDLKKLYDKPSEGFHERVVSTLDSLDETPAKRTHRITGRMIAAVCAAAIVLTAFTISAAATGLFGLIATKRGEYGLDVTVANSESSDIKHQPMKLKFGYIPKEYKTGESNSISYSYSNGETNFNAWIYYTDYYYEDLGNVVKTEETEYDGHKTLIISFREAKNTDTMYYRTIKYFDEYNCLVQCSGNDYDELVKIAEKVEVEPDKEPAVPRDVRDDEDNSTSKVIKKYTKDGDGFREAYFQHKVHQAEIGENIELSLADNGQKAVHLTAKVTSVKEQDNVDGLELDDFLGLGTETTYRMFFDNDGNLIKKDEFNVNEDADDYDLGTARKVSITRHFYVADIELTAQNDIDDLRKVFETEVYCIDVDDDFFYGYETLDYERILKIYGTDINTQQSIKKGETLKVKLGFIAENNTADNTYIAFSGIDAPNSLFQNYMIKVKE